MASRDSGRKNECVFPSRSVISCGVMFVVISGVRVIAELVVPALDERHQLTYYRALDYFNHEFLVQAYP